MKQEFANAKRQFFSAGYTFEKDGKTYLCYHTHAHAYIVEKPF